MLAFLLLAALTTPNPTLDTDRSSIRQIVQQLRICVSSRALGRRYADRRSALHARRVAAQTSAERGEFSTAVIAQTRAFASAKGPDRDQERARLQLLNQRSEQMRTGRITRTQAIQQWNQFRYSWMLP